MILLYTQLIENIEKSSLPTKQNQHVNEQSYKLTLNDVIFDPSTGTITQFINSLEKYITIPSHFDGVEVKTIAEKAFAHNYLQSVNLPSSIISIGGGAFNYNQINNIRLPYGKEWQDSKGHLVTAIDDFELGYGVSEV